MREEYRLPELADKYVNYDMIRTYTHLPPLANIRLRLLQAALTSEEHVKEYTDVYSLAVSLVQLGMDTHDSIDADSNGKTERQMRETQLNVLAGDYFSTRFYQLLAKQGQVEMIASISEAVCDVNRLKMDFYLRSMQGKMSADEFLSYHINIKSKLFMHFSNVMTGSLKRLWPALLLEISKMEVLLNQAKAVEDHIKARENWCYWHLLEQACDEDQMLLENEHNNSVLYKLIDKYHCSQQLEQKMEAAEAAAQQIVRKLESDVLRGTLSELIQSISNSINISSAVTNESR